MVALSKFARDMSRSQWRKVCSIFDKDEVLETLEYGESFYITSTMVLHVITRFAPNTFHFYIDPMLDVKHDAFTVAERTQFPRYKFRRSSRNFGVMLAQFLRKQQPMARYLIGNAEYWSMLSENHGDYGNYSVGDEESAYHIIPPRVPPSV